MSSKYTPSFAPYTPAPDDSTHLTVHSTSPKSHLANASSRKYEMSYQFGGIPTVAASASSGHYVAEDARQNQWETRYGWRVDVLAAVAYVLGPISALFVLIVETYNDYVRFHAYQSALLMTPLFVIRILTSLLRLPSWIGTFLTLVIFMAAVLMATQAFLGASTSGLTRYRLPKIGPLADQWVSEE
ncbi:hypothetical protein F5I97DRAFT_1814028 [Phlebopus sp. FC_14]|nr:hypothetical protein F5I97DRAFT_1814028 [Phlebopus sp. FC_14]